MVRRVRKMLSFQTESRMFVVSRTVSSHLTAVQEISGVKLQPGLRRKHLDDSPGRLLLNSRSPFHFCAVTSQDKIVIVSASQPELLKFFVNARPDPRRRPEIHRRSDDAADFICWN